MQSRIQRTTIPGQDGNPIPVEAIALPNVAFAALTILQDTYNKQVQELIAMIAADFSVDLQEGWQLHPQLGAFVRMAETPTELE